MWSWNTTHGLVVEEMAAVTSISTPFCFDTSAMSHILPFKSDFARLNSIEPKGINGVNGASIPTIGLGVIKVRCGKGRRFM